MLFILVDLMIQGKVLCAGENYPASAFTFREEKLKAIHTKPFLESFINILRSKGKKKKALLSPLTSLCEV